MFEVSPFRAYTFMQSITPLIHCSVSNVLIKTTPLFNKSFFQMVDVTDLAVVDSFLQNGPNRIVHRTEICTVRWPVQWADGSRVSQLTVAQPSHRHCRLGSVLLEGEEVTDDVSKEVSRIGN